MPIVLNVRLAVHRQKFLNVNDVPLVATLTQGMEQQKWPMWGWVQPATSDKLPIVSCLRHDMGGKLPFRRQQLSASPVHTTVTKLLQWYQVLGTKYMSF